MARIRYAIGAAQCCSFHALLESPKIPCRRLGRAIPHDRASHGRKNGISYVENSAQHTLKEEI
jgi:hypothetical protein